jgi:long-subunit acyl-CoA synthetase (AMP-forming)
MTEPAMLSWTSGTTGSAKAFILAHRNIASNVVALQRFGVVGSRDRALRPLPLHHAYPFVVGMLAALTLGTTIVLPGGTTGPALMRDVTMIVGVPRLYEAFWAAIEARLKGYTESDDLCSAVERDSSRTFPVCACSAYDGAAPATAGFGWSAVGESD